MRYERLPRKIKEAKLATIRSLPDMIKYAEVKELNQPNYHNDKASEFLVLEHPCTIGGEDYSVEIKIKKTPQKNKFYIHNLNIEKTHLTRDTLIDNNNVSPQNSYDVSGNNITQDNNSVNSKITNKTAEELEKVKNDFKNALNSSKNGTIVIGKPDNDMQKAEINLLNDVAKANGLSVIVVDSIKELGYQDANAMAMNGKIVVALDANYGMLLPYAGHELFHILKENDASSKTAKQLQDFIIKRLKSNAVYNYDERFNTIRENYNFQGTEQEITDRINEEISANACFTVLANEKNFKALVKENRSLAQRVADFFSNFVDEIRKRLTSLATTNAEYRALEDDYTAHKKIVKMMNAALTEYQKNTTVNNDSVRYSFKNTNSGMANDSLLSYDNELKSLFESRGDIIVDSYEKLVDTVDTAFKEPNKKAVAYFGIVNYELLNKIQNDIPNLPEDLKGNLFKLNSDYSIATTLDSIRHIVDNKSGMTKDDVIDYLDRFADTLIEYDAVYYDAYYDSMRKKNNGILFKKKFKDGTYQSFNIISNKKKRLNLITLYMNTVDYTKKKSAETLHLQAADAHTPKAGVSQTSNTNISQDNSSVNSNSMQDSTKYSIKETDLLLEFENTQKQITKLKNKISNLKNSDRYNQMVSNISSSYGVALDTALTEYGKWLNDYGLNDAIRSLDELQKKNEKLRKKIENSNNGDTFSKDVTDLTDLEITEYINESEKYFGITNDYRLAGYLTVNGKMLDFSAGQKSRVQGHREIKDILDFLGDDANYSDGLIAFMKDMIKYLSETMGAKGNEVSRALFDIELFKEKSYYPAKVAKQTISINLGTYRFFYFKCDLKNRYVSVKIFLYLITNLKGAEYENF